MADEKAVEHWTKEFTRDRDSRNTFSAFCDGISGPGAGKFAASLQLSAVRKFVEFSEQQWNAVDPDGSKREAWRRVYGEDPPSPMALKLPMFFGTSEKRVLPVRVHEPRPAEEPRRVVENSRPKATRSMTSPEAVAKIRQYLEKNMLRDKDFAERCKITSRTLTRVMAGRMISKDTWAAIAAGMSIKLAELLGRF